MERWIYLLCITICDTPRTNRAFSGKLHHTPAEWVADLFIYTFLEDNVVCCSWKGCSLKHDNMHQTIGTKYCQKVGQPTYGIKYDISKMSSNMHQIYDTVWATVVKLAQA